MRPLALTAPTRRRVAADLDFWHRAVDMRREWRDVGFATEPADRDAAEETLTRLYRRHGRARPRFAWVDSPRDAMPLVAEVPSHDDLQRWLRPRPPSGRPPLAGDIAAGWSRLLAAVDEGADPRLGPLRPPGSCGCWWPGEEVCVVAERPARIEPVPMPDDTLPQPARPAVTYRG